MIRNIAISCDHAGFKLKEQLKAYLSAKGFNVIDFGSFSEESVDYPDYAHPLAIAVEEGKCDIGFTLCGTGNGISMAANKHPKIRAALCWNVEIASLARLHNDANVCALPARFISGKEAIDILNAFLATEFEGGRHLKRVEKIQI